MSADEILQKKRKEHRRRLIRWRVTSYLSIVALLCVIGWSIYSNRQLEATHNAELEMVKDYYIASGKEFQEIRTYEYELMWRRADITSNQNTIEQNINTSYNLIIAMSSETEDDAMIKIIEERISHVRETMNTADLLQAIAILKENFPDESYTELDRISELNTDLINRTVKLKETYNDKVAEYNQYYTDHKDQLDSIGFVPFEFELYEIESVGWLVLS